MGNAREVIKHEDQEGQNTREEKNRLVLARHKGLRALLDGTGDVLHLPGSAPLPANIAGQIPGEPQGSKANHDNEDDQHNL